ncbi:SdpI family protein [Bacillus wiedmannii]|uniref:SdpI family protein n=1 Tax=Bacillus wiedmannii TaxID=1890302 RepID=UPI001C00C0B9|nr:SdpI family protein [Bacillus wiedmannii]QWI19363.1 SdpI family protein [Bacillus wiedmannii]
MKKHIFPLLIILLTTLMWIVTFNQLPSELITHWNITGDSDTYSDKFTTMSLFISLMIGQYLLSILLPKIDPKKANYEKFSTGYNIIFNMMLVVLAIINGMTILTGLGYNLPIITLGHVILGGIFIVLGNYLQQVRPNFFIGIRTPWTLSSEKVWKDTHRFSSKLFVIAGIIIICAMFMPASWTEPIIFTAAIICIVLSMFSSYCFFRKAIK